MTEKEIRQYWASKIDEFDAECPESPEMESVVALAVSDISFRRSLDLGNFELISLKERHFLI
jgi:hypothetical protein